MERTGEDVEALVEEVELLDLDPARLGRAHERQAVEQGRDGAEVLVLIGVEELLEEDVLRSEAPGDDRLEQDLDDVVGKGLCARGESQSCSLRST